VERIASFSFSSTTPGDAKFLAPAPGSKYGAVPGPKAGEKPYIGAVAP
jgi:hypothetical protein